MCQFGNGCKNTLALRIDRFVIGGRRLIKDVFVDETLLKINGENYYWLWLAYEPNCMYVCYSIYQGGRELSLCVTSFSSK